MDPLTMGLMGGSILSGLGGFFGSKTQGAANQQAGQWNALANMQGINAATGLFNDAKGYLTPYANTGSKSLGLLWNFLNGGAGAAGVGGGGASLFTTFNPTMEQLENTPGYKFTLDQATKAANNAASARGLGSSGNALYGGVSLAKDLASTTFQQNFKNYMDQNLATYNMLSGISNMGLSAGNSIMSGASALGGNIMNASANIGNAIGGGIMGAGNASATGTNALFGGIGSAMALPYFASKMPQMDASGSKTNYGMNPALFTGGGAPQYNYFGGQYVPTFG